MLSSVMAVVSFFGVQAFGYWYGNDNNKKHYWYYEIGTFLLMTLPLFIKYCWQRAKNREHIIYMRYFWTSLVCLGGGLFCQESGIDGQPTYIKTPWCKPHSWFQFHALWHCLLAQCIYLLVQFFYTEEEENGHKVRVVSIVCSVDAPTESEQMDLEQTVEGAKIVQQLVGEIRQMNFQGSANDKSLEGGLISDGFVTAQGSLVQTPFGGSLLQNSFGRNTSMNRSDELFKSYERESTCRFE